MVEQSALEQIQQQVGAKRSRGDVPATTMEVDLAATQAHAQWWARGLKPKLEVNPSAAAEGVGGAISAWVADECNRVLGQELPQEEEEMQADLAHEGKRRELEDWGKFDVFSPLSACKVQKRLVQTRWVLTWEVAEGKKCVKARLVAKGFQDPDLQEGLVETSGCVCLRPSHLRAISLSANQKWQLWSLDVKNAFLQADGFGRDVFLHAPAAWGPP